MSVRAVPRVRCFYANGKSLTMKNKLRRLLPRKGDAYIDTLISIFVIIIFLAVIIIVLPVFIKKFHLDMFADQVSSFIAVSGGTENLDVEKLAEEMGVSLDSYEIVVSPETVCLPDADNPERIQLTGLYTVNVYSTAYIGLGGIVDSIPIELSSSARGRSEVYWKDMEGITPSGG